MAQIFGKARGGLGSQIGREYAEGKAQQGIEHQLAGFGQNDAHVLGFDAEVIEVGHHQRDENLHSHLAYHGQRCANGSPFVFPDAPGQFFYHGLDSSCSVCAQALRIFAMARCSMERNIACSS